jgi:hypothetical protein
MINSASVRSPIMWWIIGVVAIVVVVSTYVTWIAGRVDRLHARASAASSALDAALVRRAVAATNLADNLHLPEVRQLAASALDAGVEDREGVENALTKALRDLPYPPDALAMAEVVATSRQVSLTRHIHTDLVRDALSMRRRRLVRVMRFNRNRVAPAYFDIEDPQLVAIS